MASYPPSLPIRCLRRLADFVSRYPGWLLYPQLVLFAVCVVYSAARLEFKTDRNELVGSNLEYHKIFVEYKEAFRATDELIVVAQSADPGRNRQFVERLAHRLRGDDRFTGLFYKGDLESLGPKALHFLPPDSLRELSGLFKDYRFLIRQFAASGDLVTFFDHVNSQFRAAGRQSPEQATELLRLLPTLTRVTHLALESIEYPGATASVGLTELLAPKNLDEIYLTLGEGRFFLMSLRARESVSTDEAIRKLQERVEATQRQVAGVNAGVTGGPVLEYQEMAQAQRDMLMASIASLVLVSLIFIFGYHETRRPIKATLCLLLGLGYTVGYTTAVVGHLNILTITFAPILIGLAIDLGIHLVSRYEEGLRVFEPKRRAIEKAMVETGHGILTGAMTTAGAFFAMALTNFKGVREMGIITGGGMLICLVPMMTVLPILLLRERSGERAPREPKPPVETRRARLERISLRYPGCTVGGILVLTGLALLQARQVGFDYNLLHLQSPNLPSVQWEKKLIASASKSALHGAVVADSVEEAVRLEQSLTNLTTVRSVDSMASFLKGTKGEKRDLIRQIQEAAAGVELARVSDRPVNLPALRQSLWSLQGYLGLADAAAAELERGGDRRPRQAIRELSGAVLRLRQGISDGNAEAVKRALTQFQRELFDNMQETFRTLKEQGAESRIRPEDLPGALRERFVSDDGKLLLQVYPKSNIWARAHQEAFVQEIRTVAPKVTGTPVQFYEYTTLLRESYITAGFYAFGAIVLLILVHFRSGLAVALALCPLLIGGVWLGGVMGMLNLDFNPANIMTLPLVIGIGVANGIHILNRFFEEGEAGILNKSTGKAVLVSGLTTMAGFVSLLLAGHRGIASLGAVMGIGVGTTMLVALLGLPAFLSLAYRLGWRARKRASGEAIPHHWSQEKPRQNNNQ